MADSIESLIPDYIRGLPVYVPGRPIEDVERELKIRAIKLRPPTKIRSVHRPRRWKPRAMPSQKLTAIRMAAPCAFANASRRCTTSLRKKFLSAWAPAK